MGASTKVSNKLWTKNFTIITIGSIISMLGNSVSGFAIGLVVLDYTKSTFLYALFMVTYMLPKIVMPLIAGPYLDRFSRRKTVYILDFLSAFIYLGLFYFVYMDKFQYGILIFLSLLIGTIDSIYAIAYESFYPNLISEGNYSKAYSISSIIYPVAACMVPVAAYIYDTTGTTAYLFLFNAISFFIAACFETRIKFDEKYLEKNDINADSKDKKSNMQIYKEDFIEGIKYLMAEKGLLVITMYFCVSSIASGVMQTVMLPLFKNHPELFQSKTLGAITIYTIVTGMAVIGQLVGGMIHYKFKYPANKKFKIAILVYASICIIEAFQLYLPRDLMMITFFITGIMGVTSFNIRISATQSYVPDEKRGRFNGIFEMVCALGVIVGQLTSGIMAEWIGEREIIVIFMTINMLAVIFIMFRGREQVKKIYNREV